MWPSHEANLPWQTLVLSPVEVQWGGDTACWMGHLHYAASLAPCPASLRFHLPNIPWAVSAASGLGFPHSKESFFVAEKCLHLLAKPQKFSPGTSSGMWHRSDGFTAVFGARSLSPAILLLSGFLLLFPNISIWFLGPPPSESHVFNPGIQQGLPPMPKPYKLPKTVSRHHPDLPIRINKNKIRIEESKSQMALPAVNLLFFLCSSLFLTFSLPS